MKKSLLAFALLVCACICLSQAQLIAQDQIQNLQTTAGELQGSLRVAKGGSGVVALIIAGSGPTDRDGNNMGMTNNSLKMLADSLETMGVSSLRYDKRGIAKSASAMKAESDLRFDDLVNDAVAWAELLRKDKRFTKLVIMGHSEGSLIGMIAANRAKAELYVSIAGIAEQAHHTIKRQIKSNSPSMSVTADPILDSLAAGHTVHNVPQTLYMLFRPSVQPYMISWFKYDPLVEFAKLNIPTLVVQGSTDLQVTQDDARALAKANTQAQLALIPGMNHVLKMASAIQIENFGTYRDPNLSLAPEFVSVLRQFLSAHSH